MRPSPSLGIPFPDREETKRHTDDDSYEGVTSNRQRHDLGNFIVCGMLAFDVLKSFPSSL